MKRFAYLVVALCALATGINTIHAASWFGFGQKITRADRNLAAAIANGDIKSTSAAIDAGAKPNAKVDGHTSLFIHAFEEALERDENNKITGVNAHRSDIARYVAATPPGGDMKDFNRDLEHYLDPQGEPLKKMFENDTAVKEFATFVEHLRNLATGAKR